MLGFSLSLAPSVTASPSTDTTTVNTIDSNLDQARRAYDSGNFDQALAFGKIAAANGEPEAQVMVGHILMRGQTGVVDVNAAADWMRKAANAQQPDAMMALGEMAIRSQAGLSPSDALHWFSMASQHSRPDAMRAIGEMYIKGQGLTPDPEKGRDWLKQAIDYGDSLAARKMGDSYFENDAPEALKWYEKAAYGGDHEAAYIAAIMYEENYDIRPDTKRMAELMQIAAEAGYPAAQADYGLLVYQGRGVPQSTNRATEWFEKAAKNGDKEGQFLYAFTLAKGEGVTQSYEDAYFWLLKSGDSGVGAYDKDRQILRERLEQNVDAATLDRARRRFEVQKSDE